MFSWNNYPDQNKTTKENPNTYATCTSEKIARSIFVHMPDQFENV